jgi:hypothetical protein
LAASTTLGAQTVTVDPRYAEFTASADHNTVVSGQPILTGYTLRFYLPGALEPFQSAPLGKPTPDALNVIRIELASSITAFPTAGLVYEARVSADGPGGTAASAVSNQFQFTDPCAVTISPTSAAAAAGAGTGTFSVTTGTGCAWTATSNQSWLTITTGANGSGSGSVGYSVAANLTALNRTATITVGGKTFTVTQAGVACAFGASPTSMNATSGISTYNVAVIATAGCGWTAASNASWITITAGASGTGNGTTSYRVTANTSTSPRVGFLTVAGASITVTQAGAPCAYTINPASASVNETASTGSFAVSTTAGCSWSATRSVTWITITAGGSGIGSGTVSYSVAANTGPTTRIGTITAGGRTFTITQDGATVCAFNVSPTSLDMSAAGGPAMFAVTTTTGCAWTATSTSAWITVSSGQSGSATGSVTVQVAGNSGTSGRTGSVTIAGIAISVTQQGLSGPAPPGNLRIVR